LYTKPNQKDRKETKNKWRGNGGEMVETEKKGWRKKRQISGNGAEEKRYGNGEETFEIQTK
jgi:hypothetical protein